MFTLDNGVLTMDDEELEKIIYLSESKKCSPLESLNKELIKVEIDLFDIKFIKLNESQLLNKRYFSNYSKIVCDLYEI